MSHASPRSYHVRLEVADKPGVLARVADAFAAHGVSIEQVRQRADGEGEDRTAELVVVTHVAPDTAPVGDGRGTSPASTPS